MDIQKNSKIIQDLVKTNFEFKQLHKEHETLEVKIDELAHKKYVSDEEEKLKKELQKKKLVGRDRMEEILRQYQGQL